MMMMMQTTNRNGSNIHDRNNMEYGCFPTGLSLLDTYLRGGCRVGSLTEIVGCAGIGKSQVAMQMALLAVTQKQAGTILIDTEAKISVSRLQEMALARNQIPSTVLSHISVHSPESVDVLRAVLNTLEDDILARSDDVQRFPVRLLIVDSIAAPIRRSEIAYSAAQQASILLGIAQTLKRLADQFRIVVLIINQVGGVLSLQHHPNIQNTHPRATGFESSEINHHQFINTTKAALGTAWHHCVSTRIRLDQKDHHRYATVVKSNVVAPSPPFAYQITHQGIVDVECATKNPL
jgi:RAD51-like protein 1